MFYSHFVLLHILNVEALLVPQALLDISLIVLGLLSFYCRGLRIFVPHISVSSRQQHAMCARHTRENEAERAAPYA